MMNTITLATQTATGTSVSIFIPPLNKYYTPVNTGVVHTTAGGEVNIEGSMDNSTFGTIASGITANQPKVIALMPYMRANVTAYTTGSVVTRICF